VSEIVTTTVAILAGLMAVAFISQRHTRAERPWLLLTYAMHIGSAFAQVWITRGIYGGGDMLGYHRLALRLSRFVRADPERFLPEVIALAMRQDADLPVPVLGQATGSMSGIATLTSLITFDSIYASCVVLATGAYLGTYALYLVYRETFAERIRVPLLIAAMGLPSMVFWSSGIMKESVAMAGFGLCIWGLHRTFTKRLAGLPAALIGGTLMGLVKPYILVTLVAAAGVYAYWLRAHQRGRGVRIRPVALVITAGLAVFGVMAFGELFPRYAVAEIADEFSGLQTVGARVSGGSNYMLAEPGVTRSLPAQLALAPFALLTALFRPILFEISGATMAVNAVETFGLTALLGHTLFKRRWRDLLATVTGTPLLAFSVAFIFLFGIGVGLASTNLGSLSRYRTPMMPLWACLLVVWSSGLRPKVLPTKPRREEPRVVMRRGRPVPVRGARRPKP